MNSRKGQDGAGQRGFPGWQRDEAQDGGSTSGRPQHRHNPGHETDEATARADSAPRSGVGLAPPSSCRCTPSPARRPVHHRSHHRGRPGDLTRFDKPTQLMSDLGLTPSEYSTGDHRRQGAITKTSNPHARRALLEGAWAYRYPAKVSRHHQLRLEKVPKAIQVIGWIQSVINKERQALLEEIIMGLPKSKGIEQEGLIYDLYIKIDRNDYRNAANEYPYNHLEQGKTDENNLYTINSAFCCGVYPDRLLLE